MYVFTQVQLSQHLGLQPIMAGRGGTCHVPRWRLTVTNNFYPPKIGSPSCFLLSRELPYSIDAPHSHRVCARTCPCNLHKLALARVCKKVKTQIATFLSESCFEFF